MNENIEVAITDGGKPSIKVTRDRIECNDVVIMSKQSLDKYYIPVQWLEDKITEKKSKFIGMCDELTPVFVMYEQVLKDWEKENETESK